MRFLAFIYTFVVAVAAASRCGGDNCARQITGTRDGLLPITSRQADCSSFLQTTVVPAAATTTVTVTIDLDELVKSKRDKHEIRAATQVPSSIPAYASGCDSASRYSSACSCWGITGSVTTALPSTKTVTVTVTSDYCGDL